MNISIDVTTAGKEEVPTQKKKPVELEANQQKKAVDPAGCGSDPETE